MNTEMWMPEARQLAAQCWCDEETRNIEMDPILAEAVAKRIAGWMSTVVMFEQTADFYRKVLDECARYLGPEVFTSDDGSIQDSPVRLKIPCLVEVLSRRVSDLS